MSFNIFKILEKDDKELIHSSFIKFLITEDDLFANEIIGLSIDESTEIYLEKAHRFKLPRRKTSKQCRFDIEIRKAETVLIIENKFKSFPIESQLQEYNEGLPIIFPNKKLVKILLCFNKDLMNFEIDWKVIDYGDLLPLIREAKDRLSDSDKKTFINHYIDFLEEYYNKYKSLDRTSVKYFLNQNNKDSKFWIKLIYSNLALRFYKYFADKSIDVHIVANPNNTSIPLLNIIPKHWMIENKELLIQIQNGLFKFYAHTGDKEFLNKIRQFCKEHINEEHVKVKKDTQRISETECIFSLNINEKLTENSTLTHQQLFNYILKFYNKIDEKIIKNYHQE